MGIAPSCGETTPFNTASERWKEDLYYAVWTLAVRGVAWKSARFL